MIYLWWFIFLFMLLGWMFAKFYPELDMKKKRGVRFNAVDYAILVVGLAIDVFLNVTVMNLFFLPDWYPREWTISERVARLANDRSHPASDRAYWLYKKFIHPHDEGHMGVKIRE